jgi:8-oxoguanine deaminase
VLGRDDIGALSAGMACDFTSVKLSEAGLAGAEADPVAALLFCQVPRVHTTVVQGRVLVRGGELLPIELPRLVAEHRAQARQLTGP